MDKKIVGNVVGVPNPQSDWLQEDATKADYIKNKPDMGKTEALLNSKIFCANKNGIYSYSLTSEEYSTEDIFVVNVAVMDGKTELGFCVYGDEELIRIGDSVVFYNPTTNKKIVGECSGTLGVIDGVWEFSMIVDGELPEMTQDKFLETYTHYGLYSNRYYWESKEKLLEPVNAKIGDIDKALDEIIAIQNNLLGVSE